MLSYSIAIRTLGTSGEKYIKLMNSIISQNIKPEKVIVVLPKGCSLPNYQVGIETFVYSEKGMIIQRLEALRYINSDYILFCDDDVEFKSDFVEKLARPLIDDGYSASAGPLLEFFPLEGLKYLLASALGGACKMLHGKKDTYTRILRTGGWSYNRSINTDKSLVYKAESLAWTCFFIKTEVMRDICFEDEMWCEKFGYSAFEDRVMFYKMLKNGYKSCVVSDALYIHNDGKTSVKELKLEPIYASAFNHYVFWHRYIYSFNKSCISRLYSKLCINYYILMSRIYNKILCLWGRYSKEAYKTSLQAFKDAKKFINSDEYKNLPSVIKNGGY